ncbi:hypothetical protein KVR01_008363 [Diaporthe batatas]|uniref:uncharacterized protein n=1 Tax=Diaporthe batatas TaxID=748121 RepID=UPI001D05ACBB|nr:uncharacterized protein KVR01_008363 [Diaporthe batatas]KAG8162598.1 hypothetical protein KVR01_008363 [Diaporthe batatas]
MGEASESDPLVKRNLELLKSGNFADAVIICKGKTWKVHRLILRSGCVWFDKAFANNWKEAQTGRVQLQDQQPEQIDDLLKFIYTGRFTPHLASNAKVISNPNLETNVSLWQAADFFLLPSLETAVYNYLYDRTTAVLRCFHTRRLRLTDSTPGRDSEAQPHDDTFFADFSRAIEKAYKFPRAREIQKLLAVTICALRKHVPKSVFGDLMETPGFQKDMCATFTALHFTKPTEQFVDATVPFDIVQNRHCFDCNRNLRTCNLAQNDLWDMTLDPFSVGFVKWCGSCARPWIKSLLDTMISKLPAEPGSV